MKKLILIAAVALMALPAAAQVQEAFPSYIQVNGRAEKEITPDEFYLSVIINERDSKGKISVESQQRDMIAALRKLGVDVEKQLKVANLSSEFFKKKTSVATAKYQLQLGSAAEVSKVWQALDNLGISNVSILKVSHSKIDQYKEQVRVEAMQQDGTLADLLQQEAGQREELQRQARAWCRLRLAHALLHRAKLAFEKERQPCVIRRAAAIFRDITAGAWQDVGAVVGDSGLRVMPPQGEPVSPEQLSRGTQEQLYLALRLAYIQDHAAQAGPLPVIMDDVLVDFDPGRARRTARILGDFYRL